MEKHFIVKDEGIINEWKEYLRLCDVERELFRLIKEEVGFEANRFFLDESDIFIVPEGSDNEKFNGMFTKVYYNDGLKKFNSRSSVAKAWKAMAKKNGFKTPRRPVLSWCLMGKNLIGKSSQTLYEVDGVLYARFELDRDYQIDDGQVEEIKASEFYKIAEDYNEKIKTGV